MNALTPVQVMFLILFVIGAISLPILVIIFLLVYIRLGPLVGTISEVLKISAATNLDTRKKVEKMEDVADRVEKVAENTTIEVKQVVGMIPKPEMEWKPGEPDPRKQDLGPENRGKVKNGGSNPLSWLWGPTVILLASTTTSLAIMSSRETDASMRQVLKANSDSQLVRGREAMARKDYQSAILQLKEAANNGADPLLSLGSLAECYYYTHENDSAINTCDRLIATVPNAGRAYYIKGLVYYRQGMKEEAQSHFRLAVEKGDTNTKRVATAKLRSIT